MSSTREQITEALRAGGDMTVTQLADLLEKSTRTIRFSLKVLEGRGMVEQVEDTARWYGATPTATTRCRYSTTPRPTTPSASRS